MEAYQRQLTIDELVLLQGAIRDDMPKDGSKAVTEFLNLYWASENLMQFSKEKKVIEFYQGERFCGILAFDLGAAWWTDRTILYEVVVLAVKGCHGLQREACKMLDKLAKRYHASLISTGCFFQRDPQVVTNGYKKFGFTQTYPTYVKVVKHDIQ